MSEFDKPTTGVPGETSLFAGVFAGMPGGFTPEATETPAGPTQEPAADPPLFTAYRPGAHTIGASTSAEQLRIIVPSEGPRTTLPGADYKLAIGALQRIVDLYRNDPDYSA